MNVLLWLCKFCCKLFNFSQISITNKSNNLFINYLEGTPFCPLKGGPPEINSPTFSFTQFFYFSILFYSKNGDVCTKYLNSMKKKIFSKFWKSYSRTVYKIDQQVFKIFCILWLQRSGCESKNTFCRSFVYSNTTSIDILKFSIF